MLTGRGSWRLDETKHLFYLQEEQEGRSGELQAHEPHLSPWKGHRENPPGIHVVSKNMKVKVIVTSQHRFMGRKSCLTHLMAFYNKVTSLVNELEKGTLK